MGIRQPLASIPEKRRRKENQMTPEPLLKRVGCSRAQPLSCSLRNQQQRQQAAGASPSYLWKQGKHPGAQEGPHQWEEGPAISCPTISISPGQNSWLRSGRIQETVRSTLLPLSLRLPSTRFYGGIPHGSGHHCSLQGLFLPLGMKLILTGRSLSLQGPVMLLWV